MTHQPLEQAPFQREVEHQAALAQELKTFLLPDQIRLLDASLQQLRAQEFSIVIVGEFSVGKSSFLNTLLTRPVLVSDVKETTATVTFLHNAADEENVEPNSVKVSYVDGRVTWESMERLSELTTTLDETTQVAETIERVDLYLDGSAIPRGVTIVDSPGLNGLMAHHERITMRQIAISHAAIFLFACDRGIGSRSEIELLRKLTTYASNIICVINKYDLIEKLGASEQSRILESIRNTLIDGAEDRVDRILEEAHFVSSKKVLEKLAGNEVEPEYMAAFERLQDDISATLLGQDRAASMLMKPLILMRELSQEAKRRLERDLDAIMAVQTDAEIEAERHDLRRQQVEAETAFSTLLGLAHRASLQEIELCKRSIRGEETSLKTLVSDMVRTRGTVANLLSEDFHQSIQAAIQKRLERRLGHKIQTLFEAFSVSLINDLTAWCHGSVVFKLAPVELAAISLKNFSGDTSDRLGQEALTFKSEAERYEQQLLSLEKQMDEQRSIVVAGKDAQEKLGVVNARRSALVKQRSALGQRPETSVWYEDEDYRELQERTWLGRVWGKITGGDEYKWVTKTRRVRRTNDSKGVAWDQKFTAVEKEIQSLERIITQAQEANRKRLEAESRLAQLEQQAQAIRTKLEAVWQQHRDASEELATAELSERRRFVISAWKQEIQGSLQAIEESLDSNVHRLIEHIGDSIKQHQAAAISRYRKRLDEMERERLAENDELNARKYSCTASLSTLARLAADIDQEIDRIGEMGHVGGRTH